VPRTFDRGDLLRRLSGDEQLFVDVIRLFLKECPERLAAIKAAVDARSAEEIRGEAHTLKGSAATLSARGLAEAADALEQIGANGRFDAADAAWKRVFAEASLLTKLLDREIPPADDPD
jgi:two-component system sensor histidine kinase/response regulator